jgi:predicted small secreted protein
MKHRTVYLLSQSIAGTVLAGALVLVVIAAAFLLSACSSVIGAGDTGYDVAQSDGHQAADVVAYDVLQADTPFDQVNAVDAIATDAPPSPYGNCTGFDTSTCRRPPAGSQVLCAEDRCLIACGGMLVCPPADGTTCQMVGMYEACR